MAAIVEDIRISNAALGDSNDTDWLLDNILDVIQIEIDFRVEDYMVTNSTTLGDGDRLVYAYPGGLVTGLLDEDTFLYFEQDGIIDDWNVGDTIVISGSATSDGTRTIAEIVNGNVVRFVSSDAFTAREILPSGTFVANNTPIQGIDFKHNLIENDEGVNFISKVDGSERRASITGVSFSNPVPQDMIQMGHKSYQYGSLQVKGNGSGLSATTTTSQGFTILQTLLIDPIFLADQIDDIKSTIAPDYFLNGNCLKYAFEIQASKDVTNPNKKKEGVSGEVRGNSGWFNENYNTQRTNYSLGNITYKKGATVNSSLELTTDETTAEFVINNTTDTPFSNGNTKMVLNFSLLPQPDTEYRDELSATSQLLKTNYIFDRIEGTLGSLSTTPDNLGTSIQVIKEVNFQYMSSSQAKVIITFDLDTAVVNRISTLSDQDYIIAVAMQNHTLTRDTSDKVTLLADVGEFFIDTTDLTMISLTNTFLEHPYTDIDTEAKTIIDARKEDDILGICKFTIDQNGRETDAIRLTNATAEIIASDGTDEFTLDEYSVSLINSKIVNGIPFITTISEDRGFKTPADENRANVKLFNNATLDAGGIFNYQFQFPFIFRWEEWEELAGADDDFFDTTEPNNGLNHNWNRYDNLTGWDVYFKVTIQATKNGTPQTYSLSSIMNTHNYLEGVEWDTENLKYYDVASGDAMTQVIQAYANTRVEGNKTYIGTTDPVLADLVIVLKINVYQKGNYKDQYTLSSAYDAHINTWWASTDTSNRVVIDVSASPIFTGKALLKGPLLPKDEETFKITCRFYDKRVEVPFPIAGTKQLENDDFKQLENDNFKRLD